MNSGAEPPPGSAICRHHVDIECARGPSSTACRRVSSSVTHSAARCSWPTHSESRWMMRRGLHQRGRSQFSAGQRQSRRWWGRSSFDSASPVGELSYELPLRFHDQRHRPDADRRRSPSRCCLKWTTAYRALVARLRRRQRSPDVNATRQQRSRTDQGFNTAAFSMPAFAPSQRRTEHPRRSGIPQRQSRAAQARSAARSY